MASWLDGCKASWLDAVMVSRLDGLKALGLDGLKASWLDGCMATKRHGHKNTRPQHTATKCPLQDIRTKVGGRTPGYNLTTTNKDNAT